jgi:hypothetical protein
MSRCKGGDSELKSIQRVSYLLGDIVWLGSAKRDSLCGV